jgi:hypothetical protein
MPFHLDFNKTLDENILVASKQFGFESMSSDDILSFFHSAPQSGGMDPITAAALVAAGKYAGYMIMRDGSIYLIPIAATTAAQAVGALAAGGAAAASAPVLVVVATGAAVAAGLWYILPSFLSEGGGSKFHENSLLVQTTKPIATELFNFMGSRYYEHIGAFAKGVLAKKCSDTTNNSTLSISDVEFKLLNDEIHLYLLKALIRKADLSKIKSLGTKSNRSQTRKSNSTNKYQKAHNSLRGVIKDPFFYL